MPTFMFTLKLTKLRVSEVKKKKEVETLSLFAVSKICRIP